HLSRGAPTARPHRRLRAARLRGRVRHVSGDGRRVDQPAAPGRDDRPVRTGRCGRARTGMSTTSWGPAELADAIRRSCVSVRAARAELTALDAAAGDGDLGESLAIGVAAIERDLDDAEPADVGDVLRRVGTSLSTAAPSTFGTL